MEESTDNTLCKTILVVEDAEPIRRLVCSTLGLHGYKCIEAGDGLEALEVYERVRSTVDLVLTDVVMPRMDGKQLAVRLSRLEPDLRLMFMSGFSDDPVVRVFERSAGLFLAKPFTATALISKVRHVLSEPWKGLPPEASEL